MGMWQAKTNNALGEINPNLYHRTDLDAYKAGMAKIYNGICKVEGTIINAPALEDYATIDITDIETTFKFFKYSSNETTEFDYLLFFFVPLKLNIIKVKSGAFTLLGAMTTAYDEDDIDILSVAQVDNNVMICCKDKKPTMVNVDEDNVSGTFTEAFTDVAFWDSVSYQPVKLYEGGYETTDDECMEWTYANTSKTQVYFRAKAGITFDSDILTDIADGLIEIYGSKLYIKAIDESNGYTRFLCEKPTGMEYFPDDTVGTYEDLSIDDISFYAGLFTGNNYPAVCSYFQGRLVLANLPSHPDIVIFSKTYDTLNYYTGTDDNDAFTTYYGSDEMNIIKDLVVYNSLIVFTDKGIGSTAIYSSITPINSIIYEQNMPAPSTGKGSYAKVGGFMYYLNDFKNKIFRIEYNYDTETYISTEVSTFSRHLLDDVSDLSAIKYEGDYFLGARTDDYVALCSIDSNQGVTAWSRYVTGQPTMVFYNYDQISIGVYLDGSNIVFKTLSSTIFKDDFYVELLPPYFVDNGAVDLPFIAKETWRIIETRVAVLGNYHLEVNGVSKQTNFGDDTTNSVMTIFPRTVVDEENPLIIKNNNSERVEIAGIYYYISFEHENTSD